MHIWLTLNNHMEYVHSHNCVVDDFSGIFLLPAIFLIQVSRTT